MKEIDDFAQELIKLGVASGVTAEAARQLASTKTIEMAAFEWASRECQELLEQYNRTKKKGQRKSTETGS